MRLELLKEGHDFSFFQVVRLLRRMQSLVRDAQPNSPDQWAFLRVRPNLSLAFPAADVEKVVEHPGEDGSQFSIIANFLGLYGASSPLPTFYTEDLIAEESEDESVSRDFYDLLNQRLFDLLFAVWSKYRLPLQIVEERNSPQLERLFCLVGLGEPALRLDTASPLRLLRYIGLLTQFPRSAVALQTLLSDALQQIPVQVISCLQRSAKIPEDQWLRMGQSGCQLGHNSYLGDRMPDRMGKFRIQLGPLKRADFRRLVPGSEAFRGLTSLTDLYVLEPLEYDVELIMAPQEVRGVRLGDPDRASLGVDSWIFSGETWGEVRAVFQPARH